MTNLMKVMWTLNVKIDGFSPLGLIFTFCFLLHFKIHYLLSVVVICLVPKTGFCKISRRVTLLTLNHPHE